MVAEEEDAASTLADSVVMSEKRTLRICLPGMAACETFLCERSSHSSKWQIPKMQRKRYTGLMERNWKAPELLWSTRSLQARATVWKKANATTVINMVILHESARMETGAIVVLLAVRWATSAVSAQMNHWTVMHHVLQQTDQPRTVGQPVIVIATKTSKGAALQARVTVVDHLHLRKGVRRLPNRQGLPTIALHRETGEGIGKETGDQKIIVTLNL